MGKTFLHAKLRLFMTNYIHTFSVFCVPATDSCLRSTKMQIKTKLAATITCSPVLEKQLYVIDWKWQVGIPEKNLDLVWIAHTFADISGDVQAKHINRVGCSRWGRTRCAFIWYILTIQNKCTSSALWQKELHSSITRNKMLCFDYLYIK